MAAKPRNDQSCKNVAKIHNWLEIEKKYPTRSKTKGNIPVNETDID